MYSNLFSVFKINTYTVARENKIKYRFFSTVGLLFHVLFYSRMVFQTVSTGHQTRGFPEICSI